ncbi:MAG: NifB/NifX family molybdenum-iron cluster-binding protein [Rhodospirillaceae bacterium]|nr:NifB/NifX family molybdenum-iron cluster-binding protein [Rhodospirillaceae bacterium]
MTRVHSKAAPPVTAITVMRVGMDTVLCPFFGKCDGLLMIHAADGETTFLSNTEHSLCGFCDLILRSKVTRLICGFVPEAERDRMRAEGIDVRVGSCARSIEELLAEFDDLPEA